MKKIAGSILIFLLLSASSGFATLTPNNFNVEPSSTSIEVTWSAATDADTVGYFIYWELETNTDEVSVRVKINQKTTSKYTITGLEPSKTYLVYMTAYDTTDTESSKTATETVETGSLGYSIEITDIDKITVSVNYDGSSITTYNLFVGTTEGGNDVFSDTDIRISESRTISELVDDTLYYIKIEPKDIGGIIDTLVINDTLLFETATTFFSSSGDIENGCFISASKGMQFPDDLLILLILSALLFCLVMKFQKKIIVLMVFLAGLSATGYSEETTSYKNHIGIKGGYFDPTESMQGNVYDKIVPFSIFYERMLTKIVSVDIEAGYSKSDGKALTSGSSQTGLESELELIPLSMSLNATFDVHPLISFFVGAGGDWWNYKETSTLGKFEGDVGGWHAKTGFKLYTEDYMLFHRAGMILEANYSQIDRFGSNNVDLGGLTYNLGFFYCF